MDREIALQKLYYRPEGYYRTVEKLYNASCIAGYDFSLTDIKNWLNNQITFLAHKPRPKFIQYASFNGIRDLNEVHKSDLTPLSHDKIGNRIFKHRGVIKDVATRFRKSCALTNKSSASLAKMFKAIYGDPNNHLTSVTEHFTKFLIDLQFHIRLHKIIICFDLDMDFLLDNNMVTAIVMINELIHLVKLYHATVIYCEQNV